MRGRVLIAADTSTLSSELAAAASENDYRVVLTATDSPGAEEDGDSPGLRTFPWNPRSLVSARSAVMKSENLEGGLDLAVVVHQPARHADALSETRGGSIEETIDAAVKGRLFMLKELMAVFERRQAGGIILISVTPDTALAPLDATAGGAFQALGDSLFLAAEGTEIAVRGYNFRGGNTGDFARFVFENAVAGTKRGLGKWFRYTGKSGLLSLR
jgi:NAD(P)-dependent dehydrogenase (short-subunit alcohol dehydrogenase family)